MGSIGAMNARGVFRISLLLSVLVVAWQPIDGVAQQRDGRHDFDWEIGTWKTHLKRRVKPLTGSNEWVEYEGTSVVRKIWDGRANLVELEVEGPAGRIEGLSLRLYNPESRQWSLNFASSSGGTLFVPTIGEFKQGRGEFYNQETLNGRAILVRFVISDVTPDSARFEQSFSDDGGKTWEANWIAEDTRIEAPVDKGSPGLAQAVKDYDQAQFNNDIPELKRLVSDDYVLVNSDLTVEDKQKVLADHSLPGFKIDPYVLEQPVEKAWGDAAVIGGLAPLSWTQDGEHQTRLVHIAHVWAKRNGRWQVAYTQVTRAPQAVDARVRSSTD
jgi:ketosteroid isomerase-like protein